jgi:hypothetical protein
MKPFNSKGIATEGCRAIHTNEEYVTFPPICQFARPARAGVNKTDSFQIAQEV